MSKQTNWDREVDEILRQYFREVVDKAIEHHPESIVEFAERSKKIRAKYTARVRKATLAVVPEKKDPHLASISSNPTASAGYIKGYNDCARKMINNIGSEDSK